MHCKEFNSITLEEVLDSLGHFPTKNGKRSLVSQLLPTRAKPLLKLICPETSGISFQKESAVTTLILLENISNVQSVKHCLGQVNRIFLLFTIRQILKSKNMK
jgi:hypothetical protein